MSRTGKGSLAQELAKRNVKWNFLLRLRWTSKFSCTSSVEEVVYGLHRLNKGEIGQNVRSGVSLIFSPARDYSVIAKNPSATRVCISRAARNLRSLTFVRDDNATLEITTQSSMEED
jgi:hypothetical protein